MNGRRKPTVYRAVKVQEGCDRFPECWMIKGGWKTVNGTMGVYHSQAEAEAAIARIELRIVVARRMRRA